MDFNIYIAIIVLLLFSNGITLYLLFRKKDRYRVASLVVDTNELKEEQIFTEHPNTNRNRTFNNSRKTILVVDNDSESEFKIQEHFKQFNILFCKAGKDAWQLVLHNHPDIVIASCQMPDVSGFELSFQIKNSYKTDTTSVILITNTINEQILMESMQSKADHIVIKPINMELLEKSILQSLHVHESIQNKIHRSEIDFVHKGMMMESAEDKLVKKVVEYIKNNIEDSSLTVEKLCQQLGFSRVHLNRKLKENLGLSPSNLIKSIRLKQAAYLLIHKKATISEVAYKVGFSSHSYFTQNFQMHFGMSPKEFLTIYADNPENETIRRMLE